MVVFGLLLSVRRMVTLTFTGVPTVLLRDASGLVFIIMFLPTPTHLHKRAQELEVVGA